MVMVVVSGLRNGTFRENSCVLVPRPVVTEKLVTLVRNMCILEVDGSVVISEA